MVRTKAIAIARTSLKPGLRSPRNRSMTNLHQGLHSTHLQKCTVRRQVWQKSALGGRARSAPLWLSRAGRRPYEVEASLGGHRPHRNRGFLLHRETGLDPGDDIVAHLGAIE